MRNDDMQGTGAVTTAGLLSGLINRGESPENLKDQRIMIAGAGEAVLAAVARRCWARAAGARRRARGPFVGSAPASRRASA